MQASTRLSGALIQQPAALPETGPLASGSDKDSCWLAADAYASRLQGASTASHPAIGPPAGTDSAAHAPEGPATSGWRSSQASSTGPVLGSLPEAPCWQGSPGLRECPSSGILQAQPLASSPDPANSSPEAPALGTSPSPVPAWESTSAACRPHIGHRPIPAEAQLPQWDATEAISAQTSSTPPVLRSHEAPAAGSGTLKGNAPQQQEQRAWPGEGGLWPVTAVNKLFETLPGMAQYLMTCMRWPFWEHYMAAKIARLKSQAMLCAVSVTICHRCNCSTACGHCCRWPGGLEVLCKYGTVS